MMKSRSYTAEGDRDEHVDNEDAVWYERHPDVDVDQDDFIEKADEQFS